MWEICGYTLKPGEKKQVVLGVPMDGLAHNGQAAVLPDTVSRAGVGAGDYELPATLICGSHPGKTILISAGVHSGEYPGVAAVIRAAKEIDPAMLTGNILLIHCINTSGFWAYAPSIVPEDGQNLNRKFPGNAAGTVAERIEAYMVSQIFPQLDFILDLHSGGHIEPLTPCLFYPKAEKVTRASLDAALALDLPYLIASTATKGMYSFAANCCDIPGLLVERGGVSCCLEEWIEADCRDIFLLLAHLKMYEAGTVTRKNPSKKIYTQAIYLESEEVGLWYANVKEDQLIQKGALLGHIEDFYGNKIRAYFAEADGRVFYYTGGLAVRKGDPLVAYGLESSVTIIG